MIGQTEIVGFHAVNILVRRSALVEKYPAHTVMDMIRLLHRMLRQGMAVEAGPHLGKRISRRRDGLDEILKKGGSWKFSWIQVQPSGGTVRFQRPSFSEK